MNVKRLVKEAKRVGRSRDPIAKGRSVLAEGYRMAANSGDRKSFLRFELLRSIVIANTYTALKGKKDWLRVADVQQEKSRAKSARARYLDDSEETLSQDIMPDEDVQLNMLRLKLERETNNYKRFLGSFREHVPGVAYAISLRGRQTPNQDSFLILNKQGERVFAIADGCGSQRFSALASYLAVKRIRQMYDALILDPRPTVCQISSDISKLMTVSSLDPALVTPTLGTTTLVVAIVDTRKKVICKVGDSMGFVTFEYEGNNIVEQVGQVMPISCMIGQPVRLADHNVEEHHRFRGKVVLTSDGITGFVPKTNSRIGKFMDELGDNVLVGERLLRAAIREALRTNMCDDMTLIIQE